MREDGNDRFEPINMRNTNNKNNSKSTSAVIVITIYTITEIGTVIVNIVIK